MLKKIEKRNQKPCLKKQMIFLIMILKKSC